ncbi:MULTISPECIES: hypothetical protein [unclassified Thalassospira]|uniref:hypothetical protein n=1 Tax=unclassified Thalassospira TaxID=2648997 RepID=UPI000ECD98DF|nr:MULTISPECIES: hypothetical protein [unclassified Thalassospira]HAI29311.1 hypothetical protein [Thalassospira sp.]
MDERALAKALGKFNRMVTAQQKLENSKSSDDLISAWEDFVIASGSFYAALEQGAKTSPQSNAWFGRVKGDRKKDPLLQYIQQARNAEEHGIEKISKPSNSAIALRSAGDEVHISSNGNGNWEVTYASGNVHFPNDEISLQPVTNRGKSYPPPKEHAGVQITDRRPRELAHLALRYFSTMIEEAKLLVQQG